MLSCATKGRGSLLENYEKSECFVVWRHSDWSTDLFWHKTFLRSTLFCILQTTLYAISFCCERFLKHKKMIEPISRRCYFLRRSKTTAQLLFGWCCRVQHHCPILVVKSCSHMNRVAPLMRYRNCNSRSFGQIYVSNHARIEESTVLRHFFISPFLVDLVF